MIPGNFFKDLENITICMKQRNLKLSFTQTLQRMLNPIAFMAWKPHCGPIRVCEYIKLQPLQVN